MSPTSLPAPAPQVLVVDLDEELVLYEPRSGRLHLLDRTARQIWLGLSRCGDLQELIGWLQQRWRGNATVIERDVTALLSRLASEGLLENGESRP